MLPSSTHPAVSLKGGPSCFSRRVTDKLRYVKWRSSVSALACLMLAGERLLTSASRLRMGELFAFYLCPIRPRVRRRATARGGLGPMFRSRMFRPCLCRLATCAPHEGIGHGMDDATDPTDRVILPSHGFLRQSIPPPPTAHPTIAAPSTMRPTPIAVTVSPRPYPWLRLLPLPECFP